MTEPEFDVLNPDYDHLPATEGQVTYARALCARTGRELPADLTKREAHDLITELAAIPTWLTAVEVRSATACPDCPAEVGVFCKEANGKRRKSNHKARISLAAKGMRNH